MNRFFVDKNSINNDKITINGDDVSHITKVLRLVNDDMVEVCDGCGMDYLAKIISIDKKEVLLEIVSSNKSETESNIKITLYQGLPKSSKMETIIQKCTELGVYKIIPVNTKRSVSKIDSVKDEKKKVERWSKIAEEAAKQSKRGIIPIIGLPIDFAQAIKEGSQEDLAIIPYEKESITNLKNVLQGKKPKSIAVFIGAEGGFDEMEIDIAMSLNVVPITLGKRILRTETAGMTVIGNIMYEYEE